MGWIQKGNKFLLDISKEELKKLYKNEKNAKAKLRLLASMKRKEGMSMDEIANSLQKPKTTIHDWLQRIENRGIKNIYDIKQSGKPPKLTKKQLDMDSAFRKQKLIAITGCGSTPGVNNIMLDY